MGAYLKVNKKTGTKQKYKFGPKSVGQDTDLVYIQFVPAQVTDVVINPESESYTKDSYINAIRVVKHIDNQTTNKNLSAVTEKKLYLPLMRGFVDVPTVGDPVLVCNFKGINYYLGPLNTVNNPNHNPDPYSAKLGNSDSKTSMSLQDVLGVNPNFKWRPTVKRMQKPYNTELGESDTDKKFPVGDMLLEGRHGNSIRLGTRNGVPNIILSNGRNDTNTVEGLNDATVISMTAVGKLQDHFYTNLIVGSNHEDLENKRLLQYEDEDIPQIYIGSDRMTFNSKKNDIIMSAYRDIKIGTGNNIELFTKNSTTIESSNIYLGKQAQEKKESLVLGDTLEEILTDIVDAIGMLYVGGTIAGVSLPVAMSGSPGWSMLDRSVKKKIAKIKSEYHFIEENKGEKQ